MPRAADGSEPAGGIDNGEVDVVGLTHNGVGLFAE
jgi:hypothetical protein